MKKPFLRRALSGLCACGVIATASPFTAAAETVKTEDTDAMWNEVREIVSQYVGEWNEPTYEGLITNRIPHTALLGNGDVGVASGGDAYSKNFYISKGDFWAYKDCPMPVGGVLLQAVRQERVAPSLARGAAVTASNYHDDYRPENAVNGLVGAEYEGWVSKIGDPQWIEFDLGQPTRFDRMVITHAEASAHGAQASNTRAFTVSARADAQDAWQVIYSTDSNTAAKTDVTFDEAVTARYLRIDVTQGTQRSTSDSIQNPRARIAQFELFDSAADTVPAAPAPTTAFHEEEDILNARITTEMELDGVPVTMDTRMMEGDNLLITALTSRGERDVALMARAWAKADNKALRQTAAANGDTVTVTRSIPKSNANDPESYTTTAALSTRIVGAAATAAKSGDATADLTFTLPAGETVYIVTAVGGGGRTYDFRNRLTGTEPTADAAALLAKAADADAIASLQQIHADWWKDYWCASYVRLDDSDERLRLIQKYYYAAQYELGCNVREDKIAPGLYGLWHTTDTPSWHSDYHMNYNFVASFYGCAASNRVEQMIPAIDAIITFSKSGKGDANAATIQKFRNKTNQQWVKDFVDAKIADGSIDPEKGIEGGALYPVGIGPWGMILDDTYWNQTYNAPFSVPHMIQYYEYTRDEAFLEDVMYPYLKPILTFLKAWVVKNDQGIYDVYAGENEGTWSINSMDELAMYRATLRYAIMISEKLGVDEEEREVWQDLLDNLAPYATRQLEGKTVYSLTEQIYENGEWHPWWRNPERLTLETILPGGDFGYYSTPEELQIMYNSMQFVDRDNWWTGGNTFPEIFAQALMIRYDPEIVVNNFASNVKRMLQPNLMIDDGTHGVEKAGATSGVHAMLLQADKGVVKVFPNWLADKDASFKNLRAPGAFLMSASYSGKYREVETLTVTSLAGETLTLASPWEDAVITDSDGKVIAATVGTAPNHPEERTYTFSTEEGMTYTVSRGAASKIPLTPPAAAGRDTTEIARFGGMEKTHNGAATNGGSLYADWTRVNGGMPADLTARDPSHLRLRLTFELHAADESRPASTWFKSGYVKLRSEQRVDPAVNNGDPEHNFGWNLPATAFQYGENVLDIPLADALGGAFQGDNNRKGQIDWTHIDRLIFVITAPQYTGLTMKITYAGIVDTTFEEALAALRQATDEPVPKGSYTDASYTAYTDALARAEAVLADENASLAAARDALAYLEYTENELTGDGNAVLKAGLRALTDEADRLDPMITSPDTLRAFEAALAAARAVLADDGADQDEVDAALAALDKAIVGLTTVYRPGDVDESGDITAADALMALQVATGKIELSANRQMAADVDGQQGVSAADALMILQYATEKIATF